MGNSPPRQCKYLLVGSNNEFIGTPKDNMIINPSYGPDYAHFLFPHKFHG